MRYNKNIRPFNAISDCHFGRRILKTNAIEINEKNIAEELDKVLYLHHQNAEEIAYLDRYYRGDQPILYRRKEIRPEVNNKIVVNLAHYAVETHTAELVGEPIQYVLRGTDEIKAEQVRKLNRMMEVESKQECDVELARWRSICGTAYRFVGIKSHIEPLDETDFFLHVEEPTKTFVVYNEDGFPMYSCQIRKDKDGKEIYNIYTDKLFMVVSGKNVITREINGNFSIPVVEYPNNARRISDIELTISITDGINKMASDRENGIEQFVSSWIKFVNCEIDEEQYQKMKQEGALVVHSNNGENKADVDVLTTELNQTQGQVFVDDLFDKFLTLQGIANREGNTGGDTQGAVMLRNGWASAAQMSQIAEPVFRKSELRMLRIVLNRLRVHEKFTLKISDIEVKLSRTNLDNVLVKAEAAQILFGMGVNPSRVIKTMAIWNDPEQVAAESRESMQIAFDSQHQVQQGQTIINGGEIE